MSDNLTRKLIYLLDDDGDFLILLKKILVGLGMEVECFLSPETFLKRLKVKHPDLCFIDLNLGVNLGAGFHIIQAIRRKISEKIILIVLSSRDTAEDTTQALEMGCDDYIVKPIKRAVIESKLEQHLNTAVEKMPIPMMTVPTELAPCSLYLNHYLYHITETGFTILSEHFIPKQTEVEFNSGVLFDIMQNPFSLRVKYNWVHLDSGLYAMSFVFPEDDRVFKTAFRSWLLLRHKQ